MNLAKLELRLLKDMPESPTALVNTDLRPRKGRNGDLDWGLLAFGQVG